MKKITQYTPLITIISIAILAAVAISQHEGWSTERFMQLFMGVFLIQFATLKIFDLRGFAKGFAKYDLLAMKSRSYGLFYPFIELALALGYLSAGFGLGANWVYISTIIVMGFGATGVFRALSKGLNINCACLGTSLNVPLSTVAVTENITMVIMATLMLIK